LPFLSPFPKFGEGMLGDQKINPTTDTGSITVKKVKVGTSNLLGKATLMFTPIPYTLNKSLTVADNSIVDSDPTDGSFQLNKVGFGSYVINETMTPEGYGPILLKTRVTVHPTNQNPLVQIEKRHKRSFRRDCNSHTSIAKFYFLELFVRNGDVERKEYSFGSYFQ
jgi:hypothetical protein